MSRKTWAGLLALGLVLGGWSGRSEAYEFDLTASGVFTSGIDQDNLVGGGDVTGKRFYLNARLFTVYSGDILAVINHFEPNNFVPLSINLTVDGFPVNEFSTERVDVAGIFGGQTASQTGFEMRSGPYGFGFVLQSPYISAFDSRSFYSSIYPFSASGGMGTDREGPFGDEYLEFQVTFLQTVPIPSAIFLFLGALFSLYALPLARQVVMMRRMMPATWRSP